MSSPIEVTDGAPTRSLLLSGCRAASGGLHLGHYYGCLYALPPVANAQMLFVINDCLQGPEEDIRTSTQLVAEDVLAVAAWAARPVTLLRESRVREYLSSILLELCSATSFRLLAEVHPRSHDVKAGGFAGSVSEYLFPLHQAAYTLGLGIDIACFNDDNSRFVDFTRKVARRCNKRFGRHLRTDTKLFPRVPGRLPGWDGRRMAKANGNTLPLRAAAAEVEMFARKLVGRADQGATDFGTRPLSETECLYLKILGEEVPEGVRGNARIEYLADRLSAFLRAIASCRQNGDESTNRTAAALQAGEAAARGLVEKTRLAAGYSHHEPLAQTDPTVALLGGNS